MSVLLAFLRNTDKIITMWGLFVGIGLGAGQILALKALMGIIMRDSNTALKLLAFLLIIIKMAAIVLILVLLSRLSLQHVIWAAGGMSIGLVSVSLIIFLGRKKTDKNEHAD